MQVALYARVSTTRQAENDLSIPDQLRQMRSWAERNGHVVASEYVEPGASATDDKRPVFQDMMLAAEQKPAPFQLVVVHSLSRFFRDLVQAAMYERKLLKAGVKLISITQQTSDDSSGEMQRHMFMLFDQYQSKEIAKHTLRGMQENARQGYFNGSKAPFGYKTVDAGQTGIRGRMKKKLAIEPAEADIVRDIYTLYVYGKNSPRMSMMDITNALNAKGTRMRGKLWRFQNIHMILSSTTYAGTHIFNKMDSKSKIRRNEADWIKILVPAIIDQDTFDGAAKLRAAMTPKLNNPKRMSSPTLLTGLLKCDCCGANMVLITAKKNTYVYYKCSNRISRGVTACKSPNYPMATIDNLVLDAFRTKVLTEDYIRDVIDELRQHSKQNQGSDKQTLKKLETELKDIEQAEAKLYEAIEMGVIELNTTLKTRIQQHQLRRDGIIRELADLQRKNQSPLQTITPQKIEAVTKVINKRFSSSTPFSRAYLKATLSEIRINGDLMKLRGNKNAMASLISTGGMINPSTLVHRTASYGTPL